MKNKFAVLIILITLSAVSCSDWFTIINRSPYVFEINNVTEVDDFESIPTLRPLTTQSIGIRENVHKDDITMVYGEGGRLKLHLTKDHNRITLRNIEYDSHLSYEYDSERDTLTLHATDQKIDRFSFIISSDPQPYRLTYGVELNAQRLLWLKDTIPVFHRIAKEEDDVHLVIVNGDLTEYGRSSQWNMLQLAVSGIPIPIAYGLGNHDYENNVEDCTDIDPSEVLVHDCMDLLSLNMHNNGTCYDWFPTFHSKWRDCCQPNIEMLTEQIRETAEVYFSRHHGKRLRNLCARRMIERIRRHKNDLANVLWDYSSDEKSLAYAWNYGSRLRFVQLHNRPNYTVELKGLDNEPTIAIRSSYEWLMNDMDAYTNRSYVINVHDATENTDLEALRPYFDRIKAIFEGHTHTAGVKCFNGVLVFNSGALFKNEFLRVDFSKDGHCLDVLRFVENGYVSPLALDYCYPSILENPCGSNYE